MKETKIEWADSTVNFWSGCTKVSAGCANCYAETLSNRKLGNIGCWGKGAARKLHQSAFNLALQLNKKPWVCPNGHVPMPGASGGHGPYSGDVIKAPQPCVECGAMLHRRRVFSLSLGDWLDPEVPIEWLARMLDMIRQCDHVQWLLVTKRPELFKSRLNEVMKHIENTPATTVGDRVWKWVLDWACDYKIPTHIMVLTSVENQQAADERIPVLLDIPAAQHGLSCEPLLGPLELNNNFQLDGRTRRRDKTLTPIGTKKRIDWVIVGGESGPGARACNVDWIYSIVEQCREAKVATFVKQLGANPVYTCSNLRINPTAISNPLFFGSMRPGIHHPNPITHTKGSDIKEWPESLRVRQFPEV